MTNHIGATENNINNGQNTRRGRKKTQSNILGKTVMELYFMITYRGERGGFGCTIFFIEKSI